MGNHSDVFGNLHWKSSVNEQRHKLHRDQRHTFKPSFRIQWHVHKGVLTCQWITKLYVTGLSWQFCKLLHIFICATWGTIAWMFTVFHQSVTTFQLKKKTIKSLCSLHKNRTKRCVCSISYISDAIFLTLKQNVRQMHHSFKSAIIKSCIRLYTQSQTPTERKRMELLMWKLPDWLRW